MSTGITNVCGDYSFVLTNSGVQEPAITVTGNTVSVSTFTVAQYEAWVATYGGTLAQFDVEVSLVDYSQIQLFPAVVTVVVQCVVGTMEFVTTPQDV